MKKQSIPLAVLLMLVLTLAGCGDDGTESGDDTGTGSSEGTFPVTVGDVEIEETPQAVVSLSPSATEMLFAIGAGDQVVAVDEHSDYPEDAPVTDLSGFEPNVEAIAGYQPDLVVASADPGDLVGSLEALDVPTLILPAAETLEDTYTQIEQLGAATGHVADAAEVVANMQSDIDGLLSQVPADAEPISFFHELDANLYTITSDTFIGSVYELAGFENIADEAPDPAGGYPQLSPEFVLSADPQVIFFSDGGADGGVTAAAIAERPGWSQIAAVEDDRVIEVDGAVASRWGPRIVDFLELVIAQRVALQPVG